MHSPQHSSTCSFRTNLPLLLPNLPPCTAAACLPAAVFQHRLLQEALASTTATPGSYGGAAVTPGPIATSSTPAAQRSSSISAAAGAFSMLAAAAAAALML